MAVNLSPLGGAGAQFFTNDGVPLTGGLLYTYLAGTTTPATTYTSSTGVTALANPIILDAAGRVPTGEIWLSDGINYKFVLKDSTDVLIATWDGLSGINSNFIAYTSQEETATATAGQTVFNLSIAFIPGTNNLAVFVNGSNQIVNVNYTETDENTVTFITGLNVGDVVKFSTATPVATNAVDASNVSYTPAGANAVTTNVQAKLRQVVSVKDFGAVGDGTTDDTSAIHTAIVSAAAIDASVYVPPGEYKTTSTITIPSNTHLYANGDATIVSTMPTIALSYQGLFITAGAVSNISFKGLKFSNTVAKGFAVLYSAYAITNLDMRENECTGCALVFAFDGASQANIESNYIHSPVTEGTMDNYSRAICISYTSTPFTNVIVANNIINGSWTHGINIQAGDISVQTDPTVAKNGSVVVVSNNVVTAVYSATQISAGGIWFSQIQDIAVTGNAVENYGDVGIDFEACTNVVASGNTLRNNNKNLALYGNNLNVRFEGNTCINTVAGLIMVWNTYSDSYSVDTRNTGIVFNGNTFSNISASTTGAEQIILGTAGRIVFSNNKIYNNFIKGSFLSLKDVEIKNNNIELDYQNNASNSQSAIIIVQSIKSTDPAYGTSGYLLSAIQQNNIRAIRVNSANLANLYLISYVLNDLATGTVSFNYNVDITDNVITSDSAPITNAIAVRGLSTASLPSYYFSVQVKRNKVPSAILYTTTNNPPTTVQIADNVNTNSLPYSESLTTASALRLWALSYITTAASPITWTLANGQFVGQQKTIQMAAYGSATGTVTIASYSSGTNVNATFTAANQIAILVWDGAKWNKVVATCGGL